MKRFLIAMALACAAASPAFAQLHETGVARSGTVARTQTGGTAFMCRLACSLDGGCAGWNWIRAGENGPQSRCEILAGAIASRPATCCASGMAEAGQRITAATAPVSAGNQYAGRSRTPNGPPVELTGDVPAGLLTENLQMQRLAEQEAEAEEAERNGDSQFAQDEDGEEGPQASTLAQEDVPTPTGRITSIQRSPSGGRPRYSVQQEYGGTATVPEPPAPPTGTADPSRWLGG